MVASGDEEAEEEEGESSDIGSVCGRDVVYGLRGRGKGGLLVVEKKLRAGAEKKWTSGVELWAAQGAKVFEES